jgi:hypothetical protein
MNPVESKNVPREIEAFREAFDKLLKEADIDQLIVLIDDLDRCLPDTAIETLEAIRLLVFTSRTAFVVAADEAMVEYAVRKHFPDLPETTGPRDYARNYLEKLIQVPFRIPALGETETRIYVTLLLAGAELGEDDEGFGRLIAAARERLKRPWESSALDADAVKQALGDKAAKTHNALLLSDQIGPILASGAKGNPRQIKRFLNTLLLREKTATARGFGDDIKLPVLAKLMLLERFTPRLFDQIAAVAAAHPKGLCDDVAKLEAFVTAAAAGAQKSAEPKAARPAEAPSPASGRLRGAARVESDGGHVFMGARAACHRRPRSAALSLRHEGQEGLLRTDLGPGAPRRRSRQALRPQADRSRLFGRTQAVEGRRSRQGVRGSPRPDHWRGCIRHAARRHSRTSGAGSSSAPAAGAAH